MACGLAAPRRATASSRADARSVAISTAVCAALFALLAAAPADAQWGRQNNDAQAIQLYNQGVEAYNAANWTQAAQLFQQAYDLSPRPLLLFNLANAQERMGAYAEAAANLRRYQTDAPIDEHAELAQRIANLDRLASGGGGIDLMIPGVVLLAVGGAMVITGAIFGGLALDAGANVTGGDDPACANTGDDRLICRGGAAIGDAETNALIADIGLIGGGVIAAAGLVMIILTVAGVGGSSGSAELAPSVRFGANGGWLGLEGAF